MFSQQNSFFDRLNLNPLAAAVAALTWALPVVNPVFMGLQFFAPLPALYFLVESGQRRGLIALTVALVISGIIGGLVGQAGALLFTVLMLPSGLVLARELLGGRTNPVRSGFNALLVLMVVWSIWSLYYGSGRVGAASLYRDIISNLDAGLVEVGETLKGNTGLGPEQALELEVTIGRLRELLPRVMPGLLLTTMLNTVFFNMLAGQYLLRRKDAALVSWPPFAEWRLPEPLVALVILAGFCLLIPVQAVKDSGINLLLVSGALYFFQGLALLTSFLNRWSVPGLLRFLIFLLLLVQAYGVMLLAVVGLVDVWADLRRPRPRKEDDNVD